jgi:hypothetical protein
MLYLTVAGMITFSLFILEEAFQTTMFGTWPAQDAGRWDIVKKGCHTMDGIIFTMNVVNYSVGWFQPLAFISYRAYAKSAKLYVQGLRAKAIQNSPSLFIGSGVDIEFEVKSIQPVDAGFLIRSGRFAIIRSQRPESRVLHVTGEIAINNNQIVIKE